MPLVGSGESVAIYTDHRLNTLLLLHTVYVTRHRIHDYMILGVLHMIHYKPQSVLYKTEDTL